MAARSKAPRKEKKDTPRDAREMLAPGVYASLGPEAEIFVDRDRDVVRCVSPWGVFEITRAQVEDGSWKRWAGEELARLRAARALQQKSEGQQQGRLRGDGA